MHYLNKLGVISEHGMFPLKSSPFQSPPCSPFSESYCLTSLLFLPESVTWWHRPTVAALTGLLMCVQINSCWTSIFFQLSQDYGTKYYLCCKHHGIPHKTEREAGAWEGGSNICTANTSCREPQLRPRFPNGFWNGFTFGIHSCATGEAQFYEKVIRETILCKDLSFWKPTT